MASGNAQEIAKEMLSAGKNTVEEIAAFLGMSAADVQKIKDSM